MSDLKTKATKARQLVEATVEADMSSALSGWYYRDTTRLAERLEVLCREFNDHVRDHRSMDHVRLSVNRVYAEVCSLCKRDWETVTGYDGPCCAYCGAPAE
jgi:hypothetical protein